MYGQTVNTRQCVFTTPGTYWVEDLVADTAGMDDVVNMYIVVTPPNGGGDTTAPTVSLTNPTAGTFVKGAISLIASATDNAGGSGMNNVRFHLDNTANAPLGQMNGSGPTFTLNGWDSSGASNGGHTLIAVGTDNASNSANSSSVAITIDNAGPIASFTLPASGAAVSGATVAINVSASDNAGGSGMASVVIKLDNATNGTTIGTVNGAGPYNFSWNTTSGVSDGPHTLYAIATDVLGNSFTISRPVTVNNTNPAPVVTSLTNSIPVLRKGNVTFTALVSGGVLPANVIFYVNGASVGSDNSAPYQYTWKAPAAPGKTYTITARATDAQGRTSPDSAPLFITPQ